MQKTGFKETEIGLIPEDWEVKKIKDVCKQVRESFDPEENEEMPYIGLEHINEDSLTLNRIGSSLDVKSGKLAFKKGHILFGKLRPYFRKVYRPDFDGVCSTDIFVINGEEGYDNGFLFYFFANPLIIEIATLTSEGTRMPRASWSYLSDLKFPFPNLDEQKAIASLLSDLDKKIELNQKMNQTLEKIGQAIFKHWFIYFEFPDEEGKPYKSNGGEMVDSELGEIPKGWEVKSLDEIADFLNGLALQKFPPEGEDYLPVIKIRELRQGITASSDKASPNIESKYIINDGDVLFSWSGSLEVCIWCYGKGALNQHLFKVTSKLYPKWVYFYWVKFYLEQFKRIAKEKATTMGHIQRRHLSEALVVVPPNDILEKMSLMRSILDKQINNSIESQTLSKIRDSLLPKLMSGKIRVKGSETHENRKNINKGD